MVILVVAIVALGLLVALTISRTMIDDGAIRIVAVAGLAAVVLVVIAGGSMVGWRSSSPEAPNDVDTPRAPSTVEPDGVPLREPSIRLRARPADQLPVVPEAVGDLAAGDVVVVGASGLDPGSGATIHQCPGGSQAAGACRPGVAVTVGDNGRVTALVDLMDEFDVAGSGRVDCAGVAGCSIVLFGSSRLEVVTVFGRPPPTPVMVDLRADQVAPGGTVVATARGLEPGSSASFVVCRPAGDGSADCGAPTGVRPADASGRVSAEVAVSAGRCPRGSTCAVSVVVGGSGPQAFAPLRLIGRSGADYEDTRVRAGLVVAGLLLLVVVWLLRRTDWAPVDGDPFADVVIPEDPFAETEDEGCVAG